MKKQKNNTGAAVLLTPKINNRRVISTILAVIFMVSMLTVTCFATGTGGTGGDGIFNSHSICSGNTHLRNSSIYLLQEGEISEGTI